jgi:hypothetical protein
MAQMGQNAAASAAGARGGPGNRTAVIIKKEGGYEVALVGIFVKIRITTDEEFNVKHIDVEL